MCTDQGCVSPRGRGNSKEGRLGAPHNRRPPTVTTCLWVLSYGGKATPQSTRTPPQNSVNVKTDAATHHGVGGHRVTTHTLRILGREDSSQAARQQGGRRAPAFTVVGVNGLAPSREHTGFLIRLPRCGGEGGEGWRAVSSLVPKMESSSLLHSITNFLIL